MWSDLVKSSSLFSLLASHSSEDGLFSRTLDGKSGPTEAPTPTPPPATVGPIKVGLEYLVDNKFDNQNFAAQMASAGLTAIKPLPIDIGWAKVQTGPDEPLNFSRVDNLVATYQAAGFTDILVALKSDSTWGSVNIQQNCGILIFCDEDEAVAEPDPTPKEIYEPHYKAWVRGMVERYDGDGEADFEGLLYPIKYYEVGEEFSSYEPEPVERYLAVLEMARMAAKEANDTVMIGHAAFLTTPVNLDVSDPSEYQAAWDQVPALFDDEHLLGDQRAVLDRPDLFDFVNIHNLGDPYELEHQLKWIQHELSQRGYSKPVVVSDTLATTYVIKGQPLLACILPNAGSEVLGVLIPPATESDRCPLMPFLHSLGQPNGFNRSWTYEFVAADMVQRTVVAAEQAVSWINLWAIEDVPFLQINAAGGLTGWGGAFDLINQPRPLFFAIQQLMNVLSVYSTVERVVMSRSDVRVYRFTVPSGSVWIAWLDPKGVLLPVEGMSNPTLSVTLDLGSDVANAQMENMAVASNSLSRAALTITAGQVTIDIQHHPVYIFSTL